MKHTEMIMVIEAHSEGKTIECTVKDNNEWSTTEHPEFNFMDCDYRVKPIPVYKTYEQPEWPSTELKDISKGVQVRYVEIKALEVALNMVVNPMLDVTLLKELRELIK